MTRILALLLLAAPVAAQDSPGLQTDCAADDLTPAELAFCADMAWQDADAALEVTFGLALTDAQVLDENRALEDEAGPMTLEAALRRSQADWIAHRDSACAAESLAVEGGARAVAGLLCLDRLTRRRIEDLNRLSGGD